MCQSCTLSARVTDNPNALVHLVHVGAPPRRAGVPAAFDSEHDENLGLTTTKEKKLKITNYPRFAIT